ncbi:SusC/RagA family TonB-linked outer membrane protein [Membranicola marinus]|uniref:SusC/RagA family TonB-linked outer membrane protein n=1 Tax=Membranihabitans marinus TaxID=1227546 RepID=A0A953L5R8_9BACT|nr:SusC/RagA family TonB-linked outer membrane protein [Membranihabitans marinus]MBY5956877.1 SusC/RagA family TonB-linked outer membrane protein [Membranihabitans marinus]
MKKMLPDMVMKCTDGIAQTIFVFLIFTLPVFAQSTKTITGTVVDESNNPLIGVTVSVVDHIMGTSTDLDGTYTLEVPNDATTLKFSYVGYQSQNIEIGTKTTMDVTMAVDAVGLEEIVVVGYGTMKKKDLTGAVSQINAEDLETEATANITDMLRGSMPGLNVGFSTSPKGISSASSMEVRGSTNVRGSGANAPLVVLDGMIYSGDLADINPSDIASFDILKDASSAAIYGSRASNGVILITTKRGKAGKPRINVSSSVGLATLSGQEIEPMNGPQFINWRVAGFESNERKHIDFPSYYNNPNELPSGVSIDDWKGYDGSSQSDDLIGIWLNRIGFSPVEIANYKNNKTIDWRDYEFQNGLRQDHNISISGRNDRLSYYWSLGYVNNEGFVYNDQYDAIRSRLNFEAEITDFLTVGTNTQFATKDQSPIASSTNLLNVTPYSSFYEDDGRTIAYAPTGNISASRHPWLNLVYRDRLYKLNSLNSKIFADISLPFGITFTSEYIPRLNWNREFNHWTSAHPDWALEGGRAERISSFVYEWQVNNILKWNKEFDVHHFDLTLLQNAEKYQSWWDRVRRNGFQPSDILGYHQIGAATQDVEIGSTDNYETGTALMARLNYSFASRYMITGSFRRDGYSAFGQKNPHANFGSVALGWLISEEEFFNINWLDLFKIRISYGTNGNRSIGRYSALSNLNSGRYVQVIDGTPQYVSQLYSTRLANSDLVWERTGAYNLGFDFGIFNGRINGNLEVYYMQTKDLLIERSLPDVTGYDNVFSNLGQVDNRGFEIGLNTVNITTDQFTWNTGISAAHNRNEIVHLYGDLEDVVDDNGNVIGQKEADDVSNQWFIGEALDRIWNYKVLGIWQEDEREEAKQYSRAPGDFKIQDINGDGVYTNDDKVFQGYGKPQLRLTMRNDFQYGNWDLSLKMYSYLGYYASNNHRKNNDVFYDRGTSYNVPYWTPENPNNEWARVESYESGFSVYDNNSFVRIDNIALSYRIPTNILSRINIEQLRLSLIAQNPYVFAPGWKWMDPEKRGYAPKYFTFKLNLTL